MHHDVEAKGRRQKETAKDKFNVKVKSERQEEETVKRTGSKQKEQPVNKGLCEGFKPTICVHRESFAYTALCL